MGQYYVIVNLDKKQYLHPHRAGDGLKLLEFACSSNATMTCLAILLADGNGRGGGDLRSEDPIVGSWAGDRIVVAGDYADALSYVDEATLAVYRDKRMTDEPDQAETIRAAEPSLYGVADVLFEDVTAKALSALADDRRLAEAMAKRAREDFLLARTVKGSADLQAKLGIDAAELRS